MGNALHSIRRHIIVEITGDHADAKEVQEFIENAFDASEFDADVSYFGCDGCGCPTKPYSPNEEQPCEDELCGHNRDTCGCFKSCIECGNPVGSNETYCSSICRIQGKTF